MARIFIIVAFYLINLTMTSIKFDLIFLLIWKWAAYPSVFSMNFQ